MSSSHSNDGYATSRTFEEDVEPKQGREEGSQSSEIPYSPSSPSRQKREHQDAFSGYTSVSEADQQNLEVELANVPQKRTKTYSNPPASSQSKVPKIDWWDMVIISQQGFYAELETIKELLASCEPGCIVHLPISHSGSGITPRFTNNVVNHRIPCIQREMFQELTNFVDGKGGLTYFHGPQGVGKSFALYHLYCTLCTDPNNRVIYIPNCKAFNRSSPAQSLAKYIIPAFANDKPFLDEMLEYVKALNADNWLLVAKNFVDHCQQYNLTLCAVIDQYNSLELGLRNVPPIDFAHWPELFPHSKILISESANHEDTPIQMRDKKASFYYSGGYSERELKSWQLSHNFFIGDDLSSVVEELGANPLELNYIRFMRLRSRHSTLPELLREYNADRFGALKASHKKFAFELQEMEQKSYQGSLAAIVARVPFDDWVYDRQLFYEDVDGIVKPVIPLAMEVAVYQVRAVVDLEDFVESALSGIFLNNSERINVVKSYMIYRISNTRSIHLHCKMVKYTTNSKRALTSKAIDIQVRQLDTIRFPGQTIPSSPPTSNALYVPQNSNYPEIDFFVYDDANSKLWAFQIAIGRSHERHVNKWASGQPLYQAWQAFLPNVTFQKVWITAAPPRAESWVDHLVFDIVDVSQNKLAHFPGLQFFPQRQDLGFCHAFPMYLHFFKSEKKVSVSYGPNAARCRPISRARSFETIFQ